MVRVCCNWYWNIYHFFTPQISFEFSILFEARKIEFQSQFIFLRYSVRLSVLSCRECASNQHLTKINWKLQIFNRFPKLTSSKYFFLMAFVVHRFLPLFISVWLALFIMLIYIFIFFRFSSTVSHHSVVFVEIIFFLLWKMLTNVFLMCDSHSWVLFW